MKKSKWDGNKISNHKILNSVKEWSLIISILFMSGVVIIGIPTWLIFSMYSCATNSQKHGKTSNELKKIDAWVFTQYLVEEHLKSPKSASFPFGGAQKHVEETVSGIYIIRSYVDAKNAFGAEVRQHFFCKLQRKADGKFEVIQLTFQ